jgi:hypothetical protein
MNALIERWRAFDALPFPAEAAAGEVNGVNLKAMESFGAMMVDRFAANGALEWKDMHFLLQCRGQLARALPAVGEETRGYFTELDAILAQLIESSATDTYKVTNLTGVELSRLVAERVGQRLLSLPGNEQFQAMLGAALIAVAHTLEGPVTAAADRKQTAERLIRLSADWLSRLLEPAVSGERGK